MKIIKEYNFSKSFPMYIKCHKPNTRGYTYGRESDFCGSYLEIDIGDIKKHGRLNEQPGGGIVYDYGVICPVCNRFNIISKDRIPEKILESAEAIDFDIGYKIIL